MQSRWLTIVGLVLSLTACKSKSGLSDAGGDGGDGGGDSQCRLPSDNWQAARSSDGGSGAPSSSDVTKDNLFSIWGSSPQRIFAVGANGTIVFYNGQTWIKQATPNKEQLTAVSGNNTTVAWAVGYNGTTLRYDGTQWIDQSPPLIAFQATIGNELDAAPSTVRQNLWGVWVTGDGASEEVFAVGDRGTLLHYTAGAWARINSGVEEKLSAIWAQNSSEIFIVGDFGTVLRGGPTQFNKQQTGIDKALYGVWGRSASEVYAVGLSGTVLRFNGSNWRALDGAPKQVFRDIWGPRDRRDVVYIVGWDGTLLELSGGPSFTTGAKFGFVDCGTPTVRLEGIWGEDPPPAGSSTTAGPAPLLRSWVVGASGTILYRQEN